MINVFEPQNEFLKQLVDSIYVLKKDASPLEFTAYPTTHTAVGLFRNATVNVNAGNIVIENSSTPNYTAIGCNQFSTSVHLQYLQTVDEIAINFKPLGFSSYTRSKPKDETLFVFADWNHSLPHLLDEVFTTEDSNRQLELVEQFLLNQYQPLDDEAILLRALALLNDPVEDYKMQEIAGMVGVHYKQLYRSFSENVGCSPAHYRKLVKFRTSVVSKIQKGSKARLVDICYDQDYTDQPYFIRQFKELTGEKPTRFFKDVTAFGNDKVIFKME